MGASRITRFQDLVSKHPNNEMFRFSLAQALDATGETTAAREHYEICVAAKTDWMLPRILLGKLKLKTGDQAGAIVLLEDALQLAIAQDHEDPAAELQDLLTNLSS
ncbi:molecular chaperone DnaJ [Opitutaceae bacterium]|nr:molecular chaperone DnaJ [Opitutaceae bacterium]